MKYDYIIIGGGASGLMLAAQVNMKCHNGLILEGSRKLGTKLLISGGGHCNITHAGPIKNFIPAYGDSGKKLRTCLYRHNNLELISFLELNGVPTTVNEEGRVFPRSMKSQDVLDLLVKRAMNNAWDIQTDSKVTGLKHVNGAWEIKVASSGNAAQEDRAEERAYANSNAGSDGTDGKRVLATENIVIATGGITFPETGSDGFMFKLLGNSNVGLGITDLKPALAPISVCDYPYAELSGVSIPDVVVTTFGRNADGVLVKTGKISGDLLFTHSGFSGPVILNSSAYAEAGGCIRINYQKAIDALPKRVRRALEDRARGASGDIKTGKLAALLENDDFTVSSVSSRGMVTRGGVELSEIDFAAMQVKKYPSMFVIGEALDVDGITGGYNLQACYSTASAAAEHINNTLR